MLGFPIRTSPDQRLVGDSPRLNAASHVLHRLLMPRHPPCALKNLATKMLASTMQISNNKQQPSHQATEHPARWLSRYGKKMVLHEVSTNHGTAHRTRAPASADVPPHQPGASRSALAGDPGVDGGMRSQSQVRFLRTQQCVQPVAPSEPALPLPPSEESRRYEQSEPVRTG